MSKIERGDRVVARWQPGTRHGEVERVYPPALVIDPTEIVVRWNDGSSSTYDEHHFVSEGFGTWILRR